MLNQLLYLKEKVRSSKAHIACNLLKNYEYFERDAESFMLFAMDTIQQHFTRSSIRGNGSPQGEANLTHASISIAEGILRKVRYNPSEDAPWDWFRLRCMMGDLFIECFYQTHQINIGKMRGEEFVPMDKLDRGLKRSRTHYVIVPENWNMDIPVGHKELLTGIEYNMPLPISELMQPSDKPIIKGWKESQRLDFLQYIHRDFVQSQNVLQQTAWKVNQRVHKALLANREPLLQQHALLPKKLKSKTIEFDLTMARASMLVNEPQFYYYAERDYRGRIYYTTPFFNYQSNDIARGQLLFAKGKLMTEEGLKWLKIHTACSMNQTYHKDNLPDWLETDYLPYLQEEELEDLSVDKMTLRDRELWTQNNLDLIFDIALNDKIVMDAEKPITLLACAIEIFDLSTAWMNGEDFYTHLPIPVDGSNNGWQHLAAMSKDAQAAELVGVVPLEIPKDFYVKCAKKLIEYCPEWFSERQMPMKHIRKGIAKRGSMTRAYSAGAEKIAENMYDDCKAAGFTKKYNISRKDCDMLAKHLIKAINDVCKGPLETMKFLQKIAVAEISSDAAREQGRKSMEWTTPSGFPVTYESWIMQDLGEKATISCSERLIRPTVTKLAVEIDGVYYDSKYDAGKALDMTVKEMNARLKSDDYPTWIDKSYDELTDTIRIQHVGKETTDKPKIKSFMSGISPNFVHSQDAAHLDLVVRAWDDDFGAVHDSFSVHAPDVPELISIIKSEFIRMYDSHNYFDEIQRMILKTDPLAFDYPQPTIGALEIRNVVDSDYFFA